MRPVRFITLVPLIFLLSCRKSEQPKITLTDNKLITTMDKMVDETASPYMKKKGSVGLSIALIEKTGGSFDVHYYNYGEAVKGSEQLPTQNTGYEIGSITKTFTAVSTVAWAILEEGENYMNILNANPATFLPATTAKGFTKNGANSKVLQLLNHTSGLAQLPGNIATLSGYNPANPYAHYKSGDIYTWLSNNGPEYTPGEMPNETNLAGRYSNLAYGVAGLILERATGESLGTIFNELWAADAFNLTGNRTGFAVSQDIAKAYDINGHETPLWQPMGGFEGAGGLISNTHDLATILIAYIKNGTGESGLNPALSQAMTICTSPSVTINRKNTYGYGWEFAQLESGKEIVAKSGGTGGSTAFAAFNRASGKAIVMLSNNNNKNGQADAFFNLANAFIK